MNYYLFIQSLLSNSFMLGVIPILIKTFFNSRNSISAKSKPSTTNVNFSWETRIYTIVLIVSILCLLVLYFLFKNNYFVMSIIVISMVFDNINRGYFYSGEVLAILKNFKKDNLSGVEWENIFGFICFTAMITTYRIPAKIIIYFSSIQNEFISDLCLLLFLFGFSVLYIFLSGLLLFEFCKFNLQIAHQVIIFFSGKKSTKLIDRIEYLFSKRIENYLIISYIKKNKEKKAEVFILIFLFFIVDVLYTIFYGLYKLIIGTLFYILIIIYRTSNLLKKLAHWICNLSDRKVTIIMFRISFVFALISLVTFNRISPLTKMENESTAILEFIASSLIIPLVLSWIMEYKNLQNVDKKNLLLSKRRILSKRKYK